MSIQTSPTTAALMAAMLKFQGAVEGVKRDSTNPHFKNRYASLENVVDTARPHLQANGLVFMQSPGAVLDGCIEVTTRISHAESGEWVQSTMHIPLAKRDPQGAGSALTYGQRYSLMAALGLPPTDDDAETSYDRKNERPQPQGKPEPKHDPVRTPAVETYTTEGGFKRARGERSLESDSYDEWQLLTAAMRMSQSLDALDDWIGNHKARIGKLVDRHYDEFYSDYLDKKSDLTDQRAAA